jgi:hypothetical protein
MLCPIPLDFRIRFSIDCYVFLHMCMKWIHTAMVIPVGLHVSIQLTNTRILIKFEISVMLLEILLPAAARHLFWLQGVQPAMASTQPPILRVP